MDYIVTREKMRAFLLLLLSEQMKCKTFVAINCKSVKICLAEKRGKFYAHASQVLHVHLRAELLPDRRLSGLQRLQLPVDRPSQSWSSVEIPGRMQKGKRFISRPGDERRRLQRKETRAENQAETLFQGNFYMTKVFYNECSSV